MNRWNRAKKTAALMLLALWAVALTPHMVFAANDAQKMKVEYRAGSADGQELQLPLRTQMQTAADALGAGGVQATELQIWGEGQWSQEDFEALAEFLGGEAAYKTINTLHITCQNMGKVYGDFAQTNIASLAMDYATELDVNFVAPKGLVSLSLLQIKEVGYEAFRALAKLKDINLPLVEVVGEAAFYACTSIETVNLPKALTIKSRAFWGCTGITTLSLPQAVNIEKQAFSGNSKLKTAYLPKVQEIAARAFLGCVNLQEVCMQMVQTIESKAFERCSLLTKIRLGSAPPEVIDENAFLGTPDAVEYSILWSNSAPANWSGAKLSAHHVSQISFEGQPSASVPSSLPDAPAATYRVIYDSNHGNKGSSEIADQAGLLYGSSVAVCSQVPVRAGFVFAGWAISTAGTGTRYYAGNEFVIFADTRLYAQWKAPQPTPSPQDKPDAEPVNTGGAQDTGQDTPKGSNAKKVVNAGSPTAPKSRVVHKEILLPIICGGSVSALVLAIGIGLLRRRIGG